MANQYKYNSIAAIESKQRAKDLYDAIQDRRKKKVIISKHLERLNGTTGNP